MITTLGAISLFEQFKSKRGRLIRLCVSKQWSEWLELDFKITASTDGRLTRDDRRSLGKELSAFANSQGGLIVWGVEASRGAPDEADVARATRPIQHLAALLRTLRRRLRRRCRQQSWEYNTYRSGTAARRAVSSSHLCQRSTAIRS